jgi:hypothetical protein
MVSENNVMCHHVCCAVSVSLALIKLCIYFCHCFYITSLCTCHVLFIVCNKFYSCLYVSYSIFTIGVEVLNVPEHVLKYFYTLLIYIDPRFLTSWWHNSAAVILVGSPYIIPCSFYRFGTNVSLAVPSASNVTVTLNLQLPPPQNEIHTILTKLHYTKDYKHVQEVVQYSTYYSKKLYATFGEVSIEYVLLHTAHELK